MSTGIKWLSPYQMVRFNYELVMVKSLL